MEFGLNEAQRLFDESLRAFLKERMPIEAMRKLAESDSGYDDGFWRELVALGVTGLLVPEEYGGTGLACLDAGIAAEALGYAAAPTPFASAAVMAPLALRLLGSEAQQADWLPRIASGEIRIATGFCGLAGTNETGTLALGNAISGRADGVIDAGGATHFLLISESGSALVAADAPGVSVRKRRTIDRTRPLAEVTVSDAAGETLAGGRDVVLRILDAGRVALAADALGATQHMLDRAIPFTLERRQFDRQIGSFQAIKHQFADIVTALEPCRALVWYAAHAQDAVPEDRRALACHAKAHLGEVTRTAARMLIEIHGGMGFTDLLGLHYWFKRVNYDRQMLGGPERCRREAAVAQGWAEAV